MKNLSLIPVAGQRARTMPTSDFFGGAGDSFPWLAGAMLAFESCEVIRLRLAKLAIGGDGSDHEACLMVRRRSCAVSNHDAIHPSSFETRPRGRSSG